MRTKRLLSSALIIVFVVISSLFTLPSYHAYADSSALSNSVINSTQLQSTFAKSVQTTFFGEVEDDGKGCSVFMILSLVIDIMTGAVAIAGVIGIMIAGIQYMSSKENEELATKAKRRIGEIVIGLVLFAIMYVGLNFLLPGGKINTSNQCKPDSNNSQTSANQPTT